MTRIRVPDFLHTRTAHLIDAFCEVAAAHGQSRQEAENLFRILPLEIKSAPAFLDAVSNRWRYDYGDEIDRLPGNQVALGVHHSPEVEYLFLGLREITKRFTNPELAELWAQAACVALLWLLLHRSPALLGLKTTTGWQLWVSVAVVSVFALLLAVAIIRLARLVRRKRVKLPKDAAVRSPHSPSELRWWAAVSLSAGFCEELIFRGFLIWLFQPWLGWWGSAGLSLLAFAAAHAYQGIRGVIAVGAVGALLTLVVFACGSL
jgi:membrane protease YdiL (CAAX protease family)